MLRKLCLPVIFSFFLSGNSFAQKITILYTGQTHSSLYHCNCPKEPDGGVARRMGKLKELRLTNPDTLLVDAGGFFAGGMLDEHSQGVELDKQRNEINLRALELMGYDALSVGDDELNFGKDYLLERIKQAKTPFLSANLKLEGLRPYIIKRMAGTNIAVIGLTNDEAKVKSGGSELGDARGALLKTIQEARKNQADLILVLSYLGEEKDRQLAAEIKDIDIIISGRPAEQIDNYARIGSTYLARPAWQGRRLSKIDLELENGKIKDFKLEQIRLSNEVADAPELNTILPRCFADTECREGGLIGRCNNPATLEAACSYDSPKKISLLVVQLRDARMPNQEQFIGYLKQIFPGLETKFIDYDSNQGKAWVDKVQAKLIPAYLLGKEAESEKGFANIKEFVELKADYYYLSPRLSGGSIFVGRKKEPRRLDVFLGTKGKNVGEIFSVLKKLQASHKDIMLGLHYLAVGGKGGFSAPGGLSELEEDIRQVCVKHYYPDKFWDYALCRAQHQESSWWDTCAEESGVDARVVKKCALSEEGLGFLRENTRLNQELEIANGPTFLADNYIVFALGLDPKIETLEKIMGLEKKD